MKKLTTSSLLILGLAATHAQAGFRDPASPAGARPAEVARPAPALQAILSFVNPYLPASLKSFFTPAAPKPPLVAPAAVAKKVPVASPLAPAAPAALTKPSPKIAAKSAPTPKNSALAASLPTQVKHVPQASAKKPASAPMRTIASQGPVLKAPSLPDSATPKVPGLQLPPSGPMVTIHKENLPPPLRLASKKHDEIIKFSEMARALPIPSREYSTARSAEEIAARYAAALHPAPHQTIRTEYKLSLSKPAKIKNPPAPIHYENMVKRLDAMFDGLALSFPKAIAALWELSDSRLNPEHFQARDALFAGIITRRAGWESVAGNQLEVSALKKVEKQDRYLGLLWSELQNFQSVSHIDRVIAKVNPVRVKLLSPKGDKANYAMARRILLGRAQPSLNSYDFQAKIEGSVLRDKIELMRALSKVRLTGAGKEDGLAALRKLEAETKGELQQESRLALARALMQKGEPQNALALYKQVEKTGLNRLEVLTEQSFAELRAGLYQDSLGKAMGLESPYFQYGFSPDVHLIEVLSRKSMCDFGGAEAGLQRFSDRYARELNGLQTVLSFKADPKKFYPELIAYHEKTEPMRFQRYLLRLEPVMENQKVLVEANSELKKIDAIGVKKYTGVRPANWDQFALSMRKSWEARADALKANSARTALAEADYMVKRLKHTFGQAELLGLDIATAASKNYNLQSALNFPVRKLASAELEKDKFHWPFEDEIWEDELDYLKMKNPSKCAADGARPMLGAAN